MIKWNIKHSDRRKKWLAVLTDIKIGEACINDMTIFGEYLILLEDGEDHGKFPADIQNRIIKGISQLNWDGYFD